MKAAEMHGYNALNDELFKFVFGHDERKDITIAFLNAVLGLEGNKAIRDLMFADRSEEPEMAGGKLAILDILCCADGRAWANIEVQIKNFYDMEKRTLYYWAKKYAQLLTKGKKYNDLPPLVMINLLGYSLLPQNDFHNMYGLYDLASGHRLTNDLEIHFLELPKFPKKRIAEMDDLEKWMAFFQNKLNDEEMEELAMRDAAIGNAWDAVEVFMADERKRYAYEQREKAIHDYASNMDGARRETLLFAIKNLIASTGWDSKKAFDVLGVPEAERAIYLARL